MKEPVESGSAHSTGHIAIVDDDESLRRSMVRLLMAYSFQVCDYASAREFLSSLELSQPACLVLDLQMNDMTGLELLHHLSATDFRIPTIIVTAHDEPGTQHRCELAGASGFLVKPFGVDALLQAVETALSKGPVGQNAKGSVG